MLQISDIDKIRIEGFEKKEKLALFENAIDRVLLTLTGYFDAKINLEDKLQNKVAEAMTSVRTSGSEFFIEILQELYNIYKFLKEKNYFTFKFTKIDLKDFLTKLQTKKVSINTEGSEKENFYIHASKAGLYMLFANAFAESINVSLKRLKKYVSISFNKKLKFPEFLLNLHKAQALSEENELKLIFPVNINEGDTKSYEGLIAPEFLYFRKVDSLNQFSRYNRGSEVICLEKERTKLCEAILNELNKIENEELKRELENSLCTTFEKGIQVISRLPFLEQKKYEIFINELNNIFSKRIISTNLKDKYDSYSKLISIIDKFSIDKVKAAVFRKLADFNNGTLKQISEENMNKAEVFKNIFQNDYFQKLVSLYTVQAVNFVDAVYESLIRKSTKKQMQALLNESNMTSVNYASITREFGEDLLKVFKDIAISTNFEALDYELLAIGLREQGVISYFTKYKNRLLAIASKNKIVTGICLAFESVSGVAGSFFKYAEDLFFNLYGIEECLAD